MSLMSSKFTENAAEVVSRVRMEQDVLRAPTQHRAEGYACNHTHTHTFFIVVIVVIVVLQLVRESASACRRCR